jgi:polysaccharide pyruvyl transferase WcaK-like protein
VLFEPRIDLKKVRESLLHSDYLLIGGGNLVMDLFSNWPGIMKAVCDLSYKLNVSYSIIGVGAGPIDTLKGKNILKQCLLQAENIYFRDSFSKNICKTELGYEKSFLMPDLALAIQYQQSTAIRRKNIILFNVASLYGNAFPKRYNAPDKLDGYVNGLVDLAKYINACHEFDEWIIFNSNYPTDVEGSQKFFNQLKKTNLKGNISILEGKKSVADLMMLGQSAMLAITTRLHAGIMVAHAGCELIGVAYQPKVTNVLKEYEITPFIIELDSIFNSNEYESTVKSALNTLGDNAMRSHSLDIDNVLRKILA